MKYLFIFTFIIIYAFFGLNVGYTATIPIWKHITYSFQHDGFFHLLVNSITFFLLFRVLQKHMISFHILLIILFVAFSMSFFCIYSRVVVGSSGMIYAMMGIFFFLVTIRKIIFKNPLALITSIVSVITFLVISFFRVNSAGMLHLLCLVSGYIVSIFYYLIFNSKLK